MFDPGSRKERSFKISVRASSAWDEGLSRILTDHRIVVLSYWWGKSVAHVVVERATQNFLSADYSRDLNTKLSTKAVLAAHVASGGCFMKPWCLGPAAWPAQTYLRK